MKRFCVSMAIMALLTGVMGCGELIDLFQPSTVSVSLINNGSFPVEMTLYYADRQEIPKALLTTIGDRLTFTIPAGETQTFTRDCDDLQAIIIKNADLRILGQIGPSTDTDVFRDGTDFNCGDHLTFTFDHSAILVDFNVTFSVQ